MKVTQIEQLYDKHFDAIYRFFYFKIFNKQLAEDLTSQTFTSFVESVNKGTDIKDPDNFLYGIARNVFNTHLRDKYKAKHVDMEDEALENHVAVVQDEVALNKERSLEERALPHISRLPESQQRVAYMRLIEKRSNSEIAEVLDRSNNYVKATFRRALRSLEASAGSLRSKVPLVFLLVTPSGESFLARFSDAAATPDPVFAGELREKLAAAIVSGVAAVESVGILAKLQNFFKSPTNTVATGASTTVVVAAAAVAISGGGPDIVAPEPDPPPPPPVVQATPPPPTPQPEPPPPEPDPPAVLAAVDPPPAPPPLEPVIVTPPQPVEVPPEPQPEPSTNYTAEFWNVEPFGKNDLPEIPEREPDFVREDAEIDFDWDFDEPADGIEQNHFVARWTKTETFDETEVYEFTATANDGVRAYVDDQIVIDAWDDVGIHAETHTAQVEIPAGTHDITVEYFENNLKADIKFDYAPVEESAAISPEQMNLADSKTDIEAA